MFKIHLSFENIRNKLFFLCWLVYLDSYLILRVSELSIMYETGELCNKINMCIIVLLMFKIVFLDGYTQKDLLKLFLLVIVAFIIEIHIMNLTLLVMLLFIIAGRNINFRNLVSFDIKIRVFTLVLIISLCLFGKIDNFSIIINGTYKQALGFSHPNTLGIVCIVILLEYIYLRYRNLKRYHFSFILISLIIVNYISGARTSIYAFILILIFVFLLKRYPTATNNRTIQNLFTYSWSIFLSFTLIMAFLYNRGSWIASIINSAMTGRIHLAARFLNDYNINLFGQSIITVSTRESLLSNKGSIILDNGYVQFILVYGTVLFTLYCIAVTGTIKNILRSKDNMLLLFVMFFIISGVAETHISNIVYNIPLMLLMQPLSQIKKSSYYT